MAVKVRYYHHNPIPEASKYLALGGPAGLYKWTGKAWQPVRPRAVLDGYMRAIYFGDDCWVVTATELSRAGVPRLTL